MKKGKAALSILVALSIILSCFTVAFASGNDENPTTAQLQEAFQAAVATTGAEAPPAKGSEAYTAAVQAVEALIANKTNISTAPPVVPDPSDSKYEAQKAKLEAYNAKLALYNTAISAYKAITEAERDQFPVTSALSFLKTVTEREAYVIKAAFDASRPDGTPAMSATDSRVAAHEKLNEIIGPHATRDKAMVLAQHLIIPFEGALKLSANLNFTKYPAAIPALNAYVADYTKADALTRMYLDGISPTFMSFSTNSIGMMLRDLIKMMGKAAIAQNPFAETAPANPGTKPKAADYAQGVNDPGYIAALNEWLPKKLATVSYNQRKGNYEYDAYFAAMAELAKACPEYAQIFKVAAQLRDAFIAFDKTGETTGCPAAIAAYDAITDAYMLAVYKVIGGNYAYYQIYLNAKQDDYVYTNVTINNLYQKCRDTANMELVAAFEAYIAGIDLSTVNNDIVAQAQAEYKKVPADYLSKISTDILAKYNQIVALYDPIKPLVPSEDKFEDELAAFAPTTVYATKFPMARKGIEYTIFGTNKLTADVLKMALAYSANGTLKGYKNYSVLSNKTMSTLLSLYHMIADANLTVSGINVSSILAGDLKPSKIAGWLTEEQFAGAKAKLLAAAETDDTTAAFTAIQFENGDWGFQDGDREGFAKAVAAMLRPVADVLHNGILIISNIIYLPNKTAANGDYVYGAYEKLIPLLESLGLKGVLSSEEYSARFQAAAKVSKNAQLDALFLPIVSPIVTLVDELQANPLNTMLDLLPRLARTISTNTLNDSLNSFLHSSSLLSGVNIDLSGDAVNAMIDGRKISIGLGDNAQLTTTLKAVDWARLAGCGKLVLADSVSAANAYRTLIETNRADAYVVASQYLVKTVLRTRIEGKSAAVALGI